METSRIMKTAILLIEELLSHLKAHPKHYLLPVHRLTLYRWLLDNEVLRKQRAYERLCVNTAEHVYPIWQKTYIYDELPRAALDIARAINDSRVRIEGLTDLADMFDEKLQDMNPFDPTNEFRGHSAGIAAVEALWAVAGRPPFTGDPIYSSDTDDNLDSWSSDTVLAAAAAYGLNPWQSNADRSEQRLKFWTWWLKECLPATLEEIGY